TAPAARTAAWTPPAMTATARSSRCPFRRITIEASRRALRGAARKGRRHVPSVPSSTGPPGRLRTVAGVDPASRGQVYLHYRECTEMSFELEHILVSASFTPTLHKANGDGFGTVNVEGEFQVFQPGRLQLDAFARFKHRAQVDPVPGPEDVSAP